MVYCLYGSEKGGGTRVVGVDIGKIACATVMSEHTSAEALSVITKI